MTLIWNVDARVVPTNFEQTLVFNNESGWSAKISGKGLEVISEISNKKKITYEEAEHYPQPIINLLRDKRILIPEEQFSEYNANVNARLGNHLSDTYLLTILPTEKCNFDCYYCYEDRIIGKMKPDVANAVDKLVERFAKEAPALGLSFFGGEPLMAPDLILRFMRTAFENAPNENAFGTITTNGSLLTDLLIEQFAEVNLLHYQITLDGPKHLHDKQRVSLSKKGTFERVLASLERLKKNPDPRISVNIRLNMHAHIAREYEQLLEEPRFKALLEDKRFYTAIHEIWENERFSLTEEARNAHHHLQETKAAFKKFEQDIKGIKPKTLLKNPTVDACYAGKPNQYMIYPTGKVGKCTVIIKDDSNFVGEVLPSGELLLNEPKHDYWIGQNALTDAGCQTCAYRITCAGIGCPINRVKPGDGTCSLRDSYDKGWNLSYAV